MNCLASVCTMGPNSTATYNSSLGRMGFGYMDKILNTSTMTENGFMYDGEAALFATWPGSLLHNDELV